MSKRQVIILWSIAVILAVLVAAIKVSQKDTSQSATERQPGESLLESFPANEVSLIRIEGANNAVTLKNQDGSWLVAERDDYPANTSNVLDVLRTLEALEVNRSIEAGPSFAPRFGMDENSGKPEEHGITITFSNASGEELTKVSLGKTIENASNSALMGGGTMSVGRYIRNHADESGFYATNEMFPTVSADPQRWLHDGFFSPEKIKSITLTRKDNDQAAWTITRESEEAQFQLANAAPGEVANATNTAPLKGLFAYTRFEDVVPADQVKERSATEGTQTASIETFEGFTYTVTFTPEKGSGDNYLLTVIAHAELPKARKTEDGESEDEAKSKDAAFAQRLKTLQDKLDQAKTFEGRSFLVTKPTLNPLLKERKDIATRAALPAPANASKPAPPAEPQ